LDKAVTATNVEGVALFGFSGGLGAIIDSPAVYDAAISFIGVVAPGVLPGSDSVAGRKNH
jgi:hypothetical protein